MTEKILDERYQILSLLAQGKLSYVYKARHVLMNRLVAIKVLRLEGLDNPDRLTAFQVTAKALGKLQHPNIIALYDSGVTVDGLPYLVMDFLEGESLHERLLELFSKVVD